MHRQDIDDLDTGRLRGVPLTRDPGVRLALDDRGALAGPAASPAAPVANLKQARAAADEPATATIPFRGIFEVDRDIGQEIVKSDLRAIEPIIAQRLHVGIA